MYYFKSTIHTVSSLYVQHSNRFSLLALEVSLRTSAEMYLCVSSTYSKKTWGHATAVWSYIIFMTRLLQYFKYTFTQQLAHSANSKYLLMYSSKSFTLIYQRRQFFIFLLSDLFIANHLFLSPFRLLKSFYLLCLFVFPYLYDLLR